MNVCNDTSEVNDSVSQYPVLLQTDNLLDVVLIIRLEAARQLITVARHVNQRLALTICESPWFKWPIPTEVLLVFHIGCVQ